MPSGRAPVMIAFLMSSSLHLASAVGVMFGETLSPHGPLKWNPPAPGLLAMSGAPFGPGGEWHSKQWPISARYLPYASLSAFGAGGTLPTGGPQFGGSGILYSDFCTLFAIGLTERR